MDAIKRLRPGHRIEIVRKGTVRHGGVVIDHVLDEGDGYQSDVERLRVQVDDVGVRSFAREISERGVIGDWRPRAKDMRRIGRFSIRRASCPRSPACDN
jgi:hypothetical protein